MFFSRNSLVRLNEGTSGRLPSPLIERQFVQRWEFQQSGSSVNCVFANPLHGLGNDAADGFVVVSRDGAYLRDHLAGKFLRELVDGTTLVVAVFVDHAANRGDGLFD